MKKYYSISEVSNLLKIETHTLRFWEKEISYIKPKKINNNRKYTDKDIDILRYVKHLKEKENYTLEGIKKVLDRKYKDKQPSISFVEESRVLKENIIKKLDELKFILENTKV